MSQDQIKNWLSSHKKEEYTAPQLQLFLGIGKSIYPNLRKLREDKEIKYRWRVYNGRAARSYSHKETK
jgi:hypothetical protein